VTRTMIPRDERVTINREFASVDELVREYVSNISRTGVFIRSEEPLEVGTLVNLRFSIILEDLETIEGLGEVVRVSQEPRGMGVVFVELASVSERLIAGMFTRPGDVVAGEIDTGVAPGAGSGEDVA
jgi:hypothetical protein